MDAGFRRHDDESPVVQLFHIVRQANPDPRPPEIRATPCRAADFR
jgi:hypothetical protein